MLSHEKRRELQWQAGPYPKTEAVEQELLREEEEYFLLLTALELEGPFTNCFLTQE